MRFLLEMHSKFIFFVLHCMNCIMWRKWEKNFIFCFNCERKMKVLQLKCIFMIHEFRIKMCPLGTRTMVKAYYTSNILFIAATQRRQTERKRYKMK